MDTRLAERLFVLITSNMDRTYEEECNMAMDVFFLIGTIHIGCNQYL